MTVWVATRLAAGLAMIVGAVAFGCVLIYLVGLLMLVLRGMPA